MKEKQFYIWFCFLLFVGNRVQLDFNGMARIQYIYLYTEKTEPVSKHILYLIECEVALDFVRVWFSIE